MKLKRIELEDFRPFFGSQYLDFSEDFKRNVTLVHAQNGQGKTTLLNALLWAFHGKFTGNFKDADLLVNKEAVRQGRTTCKVEVHFEHDGNEYRLIRQQAVKSGQSEPRVFTIDTNGALHPHPQQKAFIEQVFPSDMAQYFFFDGEYAENFANTTQDRSVHDAIRRILGCTAAEFGLEDIDKLQSRVHRQIRESTTSIEVQKLEDEREETERRVAASIKSLEKNRDEQVVLNKTLKQINDRLAEIAASALLQKQREKVVRSLQSARERQRQLELQRVRWLSERGTAVVGSRVATVCSDVYREFTKRAEIPAPYNEQFVLALINQKTCICGRHLEPGSPEMGAVSGLLSTAAESESLRRLVRVSAFSQGYDRKLQSALSAYRDTEAQLAGASDDIARLELEVQELSKKLADSPAVEVAERERARAAKLRELVNMANQEDQLERNIGSGRQRLREIDLELSSKAAKDKTLARLNRRLAALKRAASRLNDQLDRLQRTALEKISTDTNTLLQKIIRKPYSVQVSQSYGLTLLDENREKVPPSSGESQLLSLSFLAALIRFCADRQRDRNVLLTPGTVAPFVLDSPFGQLDPVYRKGAATFIPEFAEQVILLLSASQADEGVLGALRSHIGSECALVQHNGQRRSAGDGSVEHIVIDGEPVVVTHWDSPPTRTEIANVRYYGGVLSDA